MKSLTRDPVTILELVDFDLPKGFAWNLCSHVWSFGLTLFMTPYILGKLGSDGYGVLMAVSVAVSYLWVMDLGIGEAATKYIAEHAAKGNWQKVGQVFWMGLVAYAALAGIAVIGLTVSSNWLVHHF